MPELPDEAEIRARVARIEEEMRDISASAMPAGYDWGPSERLQELQKEKAELLRPLGEAPQPNPYQRRANGWVGWVVLAGAVATILGLALSLQPG